MNLDQSQILDDLAQLFRDAVLSHINDIAIDKGLGPPEFYYVSVKDKKINEVGTRLDKEIEIKLSISGSAAEYGIITPLYLYITNQIGVEKWNDDVMRVINEMMIKMDINYNIQIKTHIDPFLFDMYLYAK